MVKYGGSASILMRIFCGLRCRPAAEVKLNGVRYSDLHEIKWLILK